VKDILSKINFDTRDSVLLYPILHVDNIKMIQPETTNPTPEYIARMGLSQYNLLFKFTPLGKDSNLWIRDWESPPRNDGE
jgi:hypothetical protein